MCGVVCGGRVVHGGVQTGHRPPGGGGVGARGPNTERAGAEHRRRGALLEVEAAAQQPGALQPRQGRGGLFCGGVRDDAETLAGHRPQGGSAGVDVWGGGQWTRPPTSICVAGMNQPQEGGCTQNTS